jgi:hypothetical protein
MIVQASFPHRVESLTFKNYHNLFLPQPFLCHESKILVDKNSYISSQFSERSSYCGLVMTKNYCFFHVLQAFYLEDFRRDLRSDMLLNFGPFWDGPACFATARAWWGTYEQVRESFR